ncbi:MAG: hypothetical protein ABFS37_13765 [Acidobacteriota bacterium]
MRNILVKLMALAIVVAATGVVEVGSEEIVSELIVSEDVSRDAEYLRAREQMADLLASEEFEKVEVSAISFDQAMSWIYLAVETYLDQAAPALGEGQEAREYGVEVLRGLNEHKVRFSGDDGYDLVGDRNLLVSTEQDALDLGEVLARVAIMINESGVGSGISVEIAAKRIFEGMLPAAGTNQSLISQYLTTLRIMSKAEQRELLRYALR